MDFTGRTAVVTGAGSRRGIGRTTALYLAEHGCRVLAADLDAEGADETARLIRAAGGKAKSMAVDITDPESVKRMAEAAVTAFGRLDILVNNAGITQKKSTEEMTLEEWERILRVNLTGTFLCCQAVLPQMKSQGYGRIVNLSSYSGKNGGGVFGGSHYCAAKAGILGFSKCLAREMGPYGITVNCVVPGVVKTDIGGRPFEEKSVPVNYPVPRRAETREIAYAIAFLAGEEASYITGEDVDVNGGGYMD